MHTDTDTPLSEFAHCHEGIVSRLKTFDELTPLLAQAAKARRIASETLAFFRGAVFDHHRDEEKELFPSVLAHAQPGQERDTVQQMVDELTREHRHIEAVWRRLEPQLERVARGADTDFDSAGAQDLVQTYLAHANWEEERFLPLAQTILGRHSADMAELGLSLHTRHVVTAARRGMRDS